MPGSNRASSTQASDANVFPVENDSLGRLIALMVHRHLFGSREGGGHSLQQLGWHDSLMAEMVAMPDEEVARIFGGPNPCVSVTFDHRKVAAEVNAYRALRREQHDLEFFLLSGATPTLIHQLFPSASARTLAATRKRLGCSSKGGRPPRADDATSHAVYRCWQALCIEEPVLRTRYMQLKRHFPDISLATLCEAIDGK
jgi:hypothetical protein